MYRLHISLQRRTHGLRSTLRILLYQTLYCPYQYIYQRLEKVSLTEEIGGTVNVTCSAHHAAFDHGQVVVIAADQPPYALAKKI